MIVSLLLNRGVGPSHCIVARSQTESTSTVLSAVFITSWYSRVLRVMHV